MDLELRIAPGRLARVLAACVAALSLAHVVTRVLVHRFGVRPDFYLMNLFDLGEERTLPALFSGVLLLADAAALTTVGAAARRAGAPAGPWLGLAGVFVFLALDEWLGVHELATRPFRAVGLGTGAFYFAWVVPYGLLTLAVGAAYLRFLLGVPSRTRSLFFASAGLYVGGALGCEMLGGLISEAGGRQGPLFLIEELVEECLEMSGAALFLFALLDHLRREFPGARLVVSTR